MKISEPFDGRVYTTQLASRAPFWCSSDPLACPGPPYHPGGDPAGPPVAQPAPFSSPHCAPAPIPRRTCCPLLSALRPSWSLPLVVARVVGASLGRDRLSADSPPLLTPIFLPLLLPGSRRLRLNSPRFRFTCSLLQPPELTLGFLPSPPTVTTCHGPWHPHRQGCSLPSGAQSWR